MEAVLACHAIRAGGEWIREPVSDGYPRAGYVEFATPKHRRLLAGLAAALLSVAIGLAAKSRTLGELLPLGVSAAVAAALMFGLRPGGLARAA